MSGHKITYNADADLSLPGNNDCLKCHGKLHPTRAAIVINIDTGMPYQKGSNMKAFCVSCHDYTYMRGDELKHHMLNNEVPVNVAKYYDLTGHGATRSLSDGATSVSDNDCIECHDHHTSKNIALISNQFMFPQSDDPALDAVRRDRFCNLRCHSAPENSVARPIRDHTWEVGMGEKRNHKGCPDEPCDTHPTSTPIPTTQLFKNPSNSLPLSGYDTVEQLNNGYIVCTTCHNPHGSEPNGEVKADTQMVRLEWTEFNSLCNECHQ